MLLKKRNNLDKGSFKFIFGLKEDEFLLYLNKFLGLLISKGKKGIAYKLFNEIVWNLKKKYNYDPYLVIHKATNNLAPILTSKMKKVGRNYYSLPVITKHSIKLNLINNWMIRVHKNKTNIRGSNTKLPSIV